MEETDFAVDESLTDILAKTPDQILGSDFLTWLWFKSDGLPTSRQTIPSNVNINGSIVVRGAFGMARSTMAMTTTMARLQEALFGLAIGKHVSKARVDIGDGDKPYRMTLDAYTLSISGLRTPKLESDGGGDALEADARLLLRIDSMKTAVDLMERLYRCFLDDRFPRYKWEVVSDAMRAWIRDEARAEDA